ncbi:hypothetical protein [Tatumella sp. OPLPL6]|uniref:hypothetical protein n=1 Tax=Tatumella sp. OPLPL6 TaxID=1928657 RepID=UPI000C19FB45|nr:hypothetical protein [Tatumella sp. OPLPL6]PIJ42140.1 hypothetical protein BOM24_13090 [Tatumella sp. OPLPL6]
MKLEIKGITEEEYGLWCNSNDYNKKIDIIHSDKAIITKLGFNLEGVKSFDLDLTHDDYIIFVKVHNDKTYDIYREHLITLIKMMILTRKEYFTCIYIVSDKNQDYKNELTNFFNLNTHYEKSQRYGELVAIIKCLSMRFIGFTITNSIISLVNIVQLILKKK